MVRDFEAYFKRALPSRAALKPTDESRVCDCERKPSMASRYRSSKRTDTYMIVATAGHGHYQFVDRRWITRADRKIRTRCGTLRDNPQQLMPTAIDEMIRWVSPVRHFMRTATADTQVGEQSIRAGESVILWYPSANRGCSRVRRARYVSGSIAKTRSSLHSAMARNVCLGPAPGAHGR